MLEEFNSEKLGRRPFGAGKALNTSQPYRLKDGEEPCPKMRVAFTLVGDPKVYAVELLGAGQQFVCEGIYRAASLMFGTPA